MEIGQRIAVEITNLAGGDDRVPTFRIVGEAG